MHHRDHNHDNNAPDGSNWELLCLYCHDNEHARFEDHIRGVEYGKPAETEAATHNPLAGLAALLGKGPEAE